MIHENAYKYLLPPTIEQIDAVVKAANVNAAQFERFHGIFAGCIRDIRCGKRNMPAKYWHLFFDTADPSVVKAVADSPPETPKQRTIPKPAPKSSRAKNLT